MICSSARQLLLAEGLASERLASLKKNWGHFLSLNVNEESEHHSLYVLDLPVVKFSARGGVSHWTHFRFVRMVDVLTVTEREVMGND